MTPKQSKLARVFVAIAATAAAIALPAAIAVDLVLVRDAREARAEARAARAFWLEEHRFRCDDIATQISSELDRQGFWRESRSPTDDAVEAIDGLGSLLANGGCLSEADYETWSVALSGSRSPFGSDPARRRDGIRKAIAVVEQYDRIGPASPEPYLKWPIPDPPVSWSRERDLARFPWEIRRVSDSLKQHATVRDSGR